jgi:hypothetical protein
MSLISSLKRKPISVFFGLSGLAALTAIVFLLSIPADPKNSIIFGFSLQRLAMMGVLLAFFAIFGIAAVQSWRGSRFLIAFQQQLVERPLLHKSLLTLSGLLFLAGWIALNLPLYRYGVFQSYIVRLTPMLVWITFVNGLAFLYLLNFRFGLHWTTLQAAFVSHKKSFLLAIFIFLTFLLTWGIMALTGRGFYSGENYWYEAGVPLLGLQLLAGLGLALFIYWIERRHIEPKHTRVWWIKHLNILLFTLVYVVTAALWAKEPIQSSYFSPGPYYPNQEFAPYSDAASFDIRAQFALIGEGLDKGRFLDRGFYPAFLVFLHLLGGDNYNLLMMIQAAAYAILPAALFLIGTALHSRSLGIFLAFLGAARGLNSIASATMINSANPKMMMTDYPTAVLLAVFTACVIFWFLRPRSRLAIIVVAGGAVGAASLFRTNALFVLPIVLIAGLFVYKKMHWLYLGAVALLLTSALLTVLPWSVRNDRLYDNTFLSIYHKRVTMVEAVRFQDATPKKPETNQPAPADRQVQRGIQIDPRIQRYLGIADTASKHFLNNLSTSLLVLPTSTTYHDLSNTVKAPFWDPEWDGSGIGFGEYAMLVGNLIVIALGISLAWKRAGIAGWMPLLIFLNYHAINALARTSGGRYLVPVDWVLIIYYALGLFQVSLWAISLFSTSSLHSLSVENPANSQRTFKQQAVPVGILLAAVLFIGFLPILSESIFPRQFEPQTNQEVLAALITRDASVQSIVDPATLADFFASEGAVVIRGKLLYPRYFYHNQGIPARYAPYSALEYPRLAFTIIGEYGSKGVILPLSFSPDYIQNGGEAIVIGCQADGFTQAAYLWTANDRVLYQREPSAALVCPLPEPACDNNRNCQ